MSKANRIKERHKMEAENVPEGHYRLTHTQAAALSDIGNGRNMLAKARSEWAAFEKQLIKQEQELEIRAALVYDELCDAHGLVRGSKKCVAQPGLKYFTLEEMENHGTTEEKQKPVTILGSDGRPATEQPRIITGGASLRPDAGGIGPELGGEILAAATAPQR